MVAFLSNFGGVSFTTLQGERGRVLPDHNLIFSERHIPGSNSNYIDIGGQSTPTLKLQIFVLPDDVGSFKALIGIVRELDIDTYSYQALLTSLTGQIKFEDGSRYQYDASWLIISGG